MIIATESHMQYHEICLAYSYAEVVYISICKTREIG